jgi:hypothetical protein
MRLYFLATRSMRPPSPIRPFATNHGVDDPVQKRIVPCECDGPTRSPVNSQMNRRVQTRSHGSALHSGTDRTNTQDRPASAGSRSGSASSGAPHPTAINVRCRLSHWPEMPTPIKTTIKPLKSHRGHARIRNQMFATPIRRPIRSPVHSSKP